MKNRPATPNARPGRSRIEATSAVYHDRTAGANRPTTNQTLAIEKVTATKRRIPSADHRGAKMLSRNPEANVPSSWSAPSRKYTQ